MLNFDQQTTEILWEPSCTLNIAFQKFYFFGRKKKVIDVASTVI